MSATYAPIKAPLDPAACRAYVASWRFEDRTERDTATGCLLWRGYRDPAGYGVARVAGKPRRAHRVALVAHLGRDLDPGRVVDHLCRQRACVEPSHLEAVSSGVNVARGDAPTARNARKTHCVRGHQLVGANVIELTADGGRAYRACRQCQRDRTRDLKRLVAAAATATGLTQDTYRARFGHGRRAAVRVLQAHGITVEDALRPRATCRAGTHPRPTAGKCRPCLNAARERSRYQSRVLAAAAHALGVTRDEYARVHTASIPVAERVLADLGLTVDDALGMLPPRKPYRRRTVCGHGHDQSDPRPDCGDCVAREARRARAVEQQRAVGAAAAALGVTVREYAAIHGRSLATATQILEQTPQTPTAGRQTA